MKPYKPSRGGSRNRMFRSSEREVYSKVIRMLQRRGHHISGITRKKELLGEGAHADVVVMIGMNRYIGLKFKGECVPLTQDEKDAVKANIFTVIRSEDDIFDLLGCVACGDCKVVKE
jgi:hypothetical protein